MQNFPENNRTSDDEDEERFLRWQSDLSCITDEDRKKPLTSKFTTLFSRAEPPRYPFSDYEVDAISHDEFLCKNLIAGFKLEKKWKTVLEKEKFFRMEILLRHWWKEILEGHKDQLHHFKTILSQSGRDDIRDHIDKAPDRGIFDESVLNTVMVSVGRNWRKFGSELGVNQHELNANLKYDMSDFDVLMVVIRVWYRKEEGCSKLSKLVRACRIIGKHTLADEIEQGLSEVLLSGIAHQIKVKSWQLFGSELEVSPVRKHAFAEKFPLLQDRVYNMLCYWSMIQPYDTDKKEKLASALRRINLGHVADTVLYKEPPRYPFSDYEVGAISQDEDLCKNLVAGLKLEKKWKSVLEKEKENYFRMEKLLQHWWKGILEGHKDQLHHFKTILSQSGRDDIRDHIDKAPDRCVFDETVLNTVMVSVGRSWRKFVSELGVNQSELNANLKHDMSDSDSLMVAIRVWYRKEEGCSKLTKLVRACREIGKDTLADEIEQGLSEVLLREIAHQIEVKNWQSLGSKLDVSPVRQHAFNVKFPSLQDRVYNMLCYWSMIQPYDSDKEEKLASALQRTNLGHVADTVLCKGLKQHELDTIAALLGNNWQKVAAAHLNTPDINYIMGLPGDSSQHALKCLKLWKRRQPSNTEDLKEALYSVLISLKLIREARYLYNGLDHLTLVDLSGKLTFDWPLLANYFQYKKEEIADRLKDRNQFGMCLKVLREWLQENRHEDQAKTKEKLLEGFVFIGREDLVEWLVNREDGEPEDGNKNQMLQRESKKLTRITMEKVASKLHKDQAALMDLLSLDYNDLHIVPSSIKQNVMLSLLVAWKKKQRRENFGEAEMYGRLMELLELYGEEEAYAVLSDGCSVDPPSYGNAPRGAVGGSPVHEEPAYPDVNLDSMVEVTYGGQTLTGVIRWIGDIKGIDEHGKLAGVELDEFLNVGGTDGSFNGRKLFHCQYGKGLVLPLTRCKPDSRFLTETETFTKKDKLTKEDQKTLHLKDQLERAEEDRTKLTEKLKIINEKHQQVITTLTTAEKEKEQISDKLMEAIYEKQQLTARLEMAEKEERQMKEMLEGKERQEKQLTTKLEMTEKEKKELISRLKESDDERQQLTVRLETTDEEKRLLGERLREEKRQLGEKLEAEVKEGQHVASRLRMTEEENKKLMRKLKESNDEKQQQTGRMKRIVEENHKELEETKSNLRAAKDDLVQAQVKYAKESMAVQEVLQQTREALSKQAITSTDSVEQVGTLPKENEPLGEPQELTALAADFGRLMVDVAEDLTLDNTLRLALLFQLPNSEKDMLRRISLIETPGITLVSYLKARNIINMYDVTNLQKGLMRLHLHCTNAKYVVPYQERIDPFQFEENRSPHLADWPDEKVESPKARKTSDTQEAERADEVAGSQNHPSEESLTKEIGGEENPPPRQDSQNVQIREPYIEHKINDEGGTIALMGVSLSIPEEAVSCDHVIAVTVFCDPDVLLPGTAQRGRMTPLIKLEPEGLKLKQPARLIIPHSAIIPEPDRHSVIIFTGQKAQRESQKGHITWTEENSADWKLGEEIISLYINTLSYVFVNLVSHETEQKHMFRVVPFIDGILDAKDDVLITVCFCKDNDAEYQLLLDDYKSKLFLGSYMTFQVSHTINEDSNAVCDLGLTITPQSDSYCLTEKETTKLVDIDHLCAASRVSLQFRLMRSKDRDDKMIDVKLEVSQGEKNKISLILQSKVKNIFLSKETQDLLNQELPKDLHQYENLKKTVSNLLEKKHCEKLATIFELTPAERDAMLNDPKPGVELVKILDERELIMPGKVFGLYQGLMACHLNKIGRHILDYIGATKKEKVNDSKTVQENNTKANETDLRGKDFKLSLNARILTEEGYKRLDVQRALKLSHGKLDLGRRLLLLAKVEHERLPLLPGSNVHKEQYIDELGGEMTIAGINLLVPAGALNSGRIVKLSISAESGIKGPISNRSLRLVPFVNFGPDNLVLHKQVIMIIPHCAYITSNQTNLDVYSGIPQKDKRIKWSQERKYLRCSMSKNNLRVEIDRPCGLIAPHIPFQQKMMKNICVIPVMKRTSSTMDNLTIFLWFYNENSLEHDCLIHEEVCNSKGIVLHDPVSFQVKTMVSTLPVSISSSTSQWIVTPEKVEVPLNSLWLLNRHQVSFHLNTKGNTESINLGIESRYRVTRKVLFQMNFQFKVDDMHPFEQATSPFQQIFHKVTMESFKEFLKKLSDNLDAEQSIQLANIFQLPEDVISSIEKHSKPGNLLMEMLTKKYVISASNVSRFEYALTEIGNEQCARLVRDFRKNNSVVHATMSPGDDN